MSDVQVNPVAFSVSAYPDEDINRSAFEIRVEYRGHNLWAVLKRGFCLHRHTGEWDWEFIPSERRDEWLADHRWLLDEALAKARELAPTVTVNGHTIADALALTQHHAP